MSAVNTAHYDSPPGRVTLTVRDGRVASVKLGGRATRPAGILGEPARSFVDAVKDYFQSGWCALSMERMDLSGCSEFDRSVYVELVRVPPGELVTYGELARRIGRPGAARAVGGAVGRNPLPIFIPCHRVVAANGRLGGFGAGLPWKKALLKHEGWHIENDRVSRDE